MFSDMYWYQILPRKVFALSADFTTTFCILESTDQLRPSLSVMQTLCEGKCLKAQQNDSMILEQTVTTSTFPSLNNSFCLYPS